MFMLVNSPAFVFQILLLGGLIYFASPRLLIKKKYLYFGLVSVLAVLFCAFISSEMAPPPPRAQELPSTIDLGRAPIRTPTRFFIHVLMLSISYILATFIETFIYAQKKEEETILIKNESLLTELKLLKSQINPHFLFNALNNIYALSAIDSGKTQKSISYLSDMLRYVLYECEQELVSLDKEITYIENYIKLFSLKSSKQYPIETDFIVENKSIKIAPMLLIPFMENALKHSNIEKITDTFIRMKIHADAHKIRFEIENSISENPKIVDEVGGIGIENVKKRLAILYPDRHELLIDENSRSFKVNLNIDLNGTH